ncbi:tol-pal system protein YbgF [Marinomonas epiphytica]
MLIHKMRLRSIAMALTFSAPFAMADTLPQPSSALSPNAAAELLFQLETLQQEVQSLRGQLEEQQHELSKIKQQQRDRYIDLDKRISLVMAEQAKASQASSQPVVTAPSNSQVNGPAFANPTPVTTAPAPTPVVSTNTPLVAPIKLAPNTPEAQQAYTSAYSLIRDKKYEEAHDAFSQFIVDYPNIKLTGNGYYWLGELNLVLARPDAAIADFSSVIKKFPGHDKEADALYKLGIVSHQQGQDSQAKTYLQDVIQRYPNAKSAKLATNYLSTIK